MNHNIDAEHRQLLSEKRETGGSDKIWYNPDLGQFPGHFKRKLFIDLNHTKKITTPIITILIDFWSPHF